jgi:hypothetical protein
MGSRFPDADFSQTRAMTGHRFARTRDFRKPRRILAKSLATRTKSRATRTKLRATFVKSQATRVKSPVTLTKSLAPQTQ